MHRGRLAALLALLVSLLALAPLPSHADGRLYTLEEGVHLGSSMRAALNRIAREFHRRAGRGFVVTSGTRSPNEQAEAMYQKIRLGQRLTRLYRDYDAAAEIQGAYRANRRRGRQACIRAMARVIDAQVDRGCYISRHLRASAADVRSRDMNRRERRIFEQIIGAADDVSMLAEGVPPHFHLQLAR